MSAERLREIARLGGKSTLVEKRSFSVEKELALTRRGEKAGLRTAKNANARATNIFQKNPATLIRWNQEARTTLLTQCLTSLV